MTDRIYLDHNATTPIDPLVLAAMQSYLGEVYGNPSSVEHEHGHAAAMAVERAREQVAASIGARASEIVFTGSCTEADNLAIVGVARAQEGKKHIVTTAIEHPAVLESARALEREGWRVSYLPVDTDGRVTPQDVANAIRDDTVLVSVMGANNEVGTIQPVREIGSVCAERQVLFHSDLAQLPAYHDIDVERDNLHLASLSAHKSYGPKGVGALYIRSRKPRAKIFPIFFGGGQERGLRPGTLNTPAIVGMGEAFAIAKRSCTAEGVRVRSLCRAFQDQLMAAVAGISLNGHPHERLANNLSFSIEDIEPLALIRRLRNDLSFSASSACTTGKVETSHVLRSMFGDTPRARHAFRLAPGRFTTRAELDASLSLITDAVRRLRGVQRPIAVS